ncbi:MAG: DUF4349 domain-containing protein [Clostridia bacterium]|nr:DUF4349 domain-containing protein [Clostridia bacterium]
MKKKWIAILLAAVIAVACVACSANASKASRDQGGYYATKSESYYSDSWVEMEEAPAAAGMATSNSYSAVNTSANEQVPQEVGRKLIRDASMTIETKLFDEMIPELQAHIAVCGGYIESMTESGNSYNSSSYRRAYFTARIPADRLDEFLGKVDGIGNVTSKSLSTRDVTSQYVDVESRLEVLRTEKESLERIMAAAETTVDMLEVQSRLYDVIEEIESYEATKRTYDALISYSTVNINVQEVIELTPPKEETRWEELSRRFATSLDNLGEGIVDFGIGFVVALPWLLVFGVVFGGIALAIILPIRAKVKKRRAAAAKKEENK